MLLVWSIRDEVADPRHEAGGPLDPTPTWCRRTIQTPKTKTMRVRDLPNVSRHHTWLAEGVVDGGRGGI